MIYVSVMRFVSVVSWLMMMVILMCVIRGFLCVISSVCVMLLFIDVGRNVFANVEIV